jgi:hypothetical protein
MNGMAPPQMAGAHQLKHLDRLRQALHRHWPQRGDLDQALHQSQSRRTEADAPRGGRLFHARRQDRGFPDRRVVHMQIVANGPHHHFPRIETHAHAQLQATAAAYLLGVSTHGGLHGQSRVAGAQGVVFVGNGGPEQGHNAIAEDLVHRALKTVHGVHHVLEGRVKELLGGFRVEAADEFRRVLEIDKQHRHLLALPGEGRTGRQDLGGEIERRVGLGGRHARLWGVEFGGQRRATATAELLLRLIRKATRRTGQGQWRPALGTEPASGAILGVAMGTLHVRASSQ